MDIMALGQVILGPIFKIIDKAVPDKTKAMELKADIEKMVLESKSELQQTMREIAVAEVKGNWFQSSWRPLLSYVLIFEIFWAGFAHGIVEAVFETQIATIGFENLVALGGVWSAVYGLGRSFEKTGSSFKFKRES